MKSLNMLKLEAETSRVYRVNNNQFEYIDWHVRDMIERIPGKDWSSCCSVIKGQPNKTPYELELKHMIQWGRADARVIEDAFQVTLPDCVHSFYSEIQEAVLNWKNTYHILRPEHVVAWEKLYRDLCEDTYLPVNLIRFCKLDRTGDSIALRKHTQTGRWHIDYAAVDQSTEEIQSSDFDEEPLATSLDDWLIDLINNDGVIDPDREQMLERLN